ncbi:alanine--tRNA ligase, partial [archaeon]|nr:alanine--tRNA ligase [archaeon]
DQRGVSPSNLGAGYVLRRLIRRSVRHGRLIGAQQGFTQRLAETVIKQYSNDYPELNEKKQFILDQLGLEEDKFSKTLERGLNQFKRIVDGAKAISGKDAFILFTTYGFPLEMTKELAKEHNVTVDEKGFEREYANHVKQSRESMQKTFKGGLADAKVETTKLHTATHLLHAALRKVLGDSVQQKGSNITSDRLRFDFSFDRKLTDDEIAKVQELVNKTIQQNIPITKELLSPSDAKKSGALGFFESKYGDTVSVYTVGKFSKEICGGPHVASTGELKKFTITKQEAVGSGVRRIKATVG